MTPLQEDAVHAKKLLAISTSEDAETYFADLMRRFVPGELEQVLGGTLDIEPSDRPTVRRAKEARLLVMNFTEIGMD